MVTGGVVVTGGVGVVGVEPASFLLQDANSNRRAERDKAEEDVDFMWPGLVPVR